MKSFGWQNENERRKSILQELLTNIPTVNDIAAQRHWGDAQLELQQQAKQVEIDLRQLVAVSHFEACRDRTYAEVMQKMNDSSLHFFRQLAFGPQDIHLLVKQLLIQ